MTEKVVIPPAEHIDLYPRRLTKQQGLDYQPFAPQEDLVPEMAHAGEGHRFHVTGLTHDERGYPNMTPPAQDKLVRRLKEKIDRAADDIILFEEEGTGDADVVVVSYGITSRVAQRAIDLARVQGLKVGKFRIITAWPFPEKRLRELAARIRAFVVPELNLGQMALEVQRVAGRHALTFPVTHAGGSVHKPEEIVAAIQEAARC
jgi:2-oxoglutarate/2-oxoacid ferredoxin oxidoreductase subunit alpha